MGRIAAEAATHLRNAAVLASTEHMTGAAHVVLGHHETAADHRALAMHRDQGYRTGEAAGREALGIYLQRGMEAETERVQRLLARTRR
ncbi:hypothetical protein SAMN04488074_107225 [Lentzea albidocapillata subsp. violacea]|uniref:Uncharacterized protein n=2 Tax=Lentzea albidocapillata TaxID=40571 RepID=A0A1G9F1D6_9PSEU|nr:hypothetical protein SAMN04488074_107225 [Lentzea albidocapillata subsp. violacea]